ncbi:MAG TPA: hypothetical protein VHX65_01040 [Pirellulales bacterium]|jgi:hypothetical protein|nr:hypothetical protein [Pirellulales bacterium]
MSTQGAQVGSVAAIEAFQVALANYIEESKQALVMIDLEIRRAVDWVRIDRAEHWKHEIRRAGDAVNRAKDDLHRCISFKSMDNYTPSCVDERKNLQRAQERLKNAEQKAEAVRRWTRAMQHELNEYAGRIVQFNAALEGDIPKSMLTLKRILDTLDRYVHTTAPRPMSESAMVRPGALNQPDDANDSASMAQPLDEPEQPPAAAELESQPNGHSSAATVADSGDAAALPRPSSLAPRPSAEPAAGDTEARP